MERPIVLNSLLAFVHNYRDHPQLETLIEENFSKTAVAEARSVLVTYLGGLGALAVPDHLVALYDEVAARGTLPVLAAADLSALPLVVLGQENDKNELIREMRQLKRFIHDAFNGRIDDPLPSTRLSESAATPICRQKLQNSASSPEFPTAVPVAPVSLKPQTPEIQQMDEPVVAEAGGATCSATPPRSAKRRAGGKSLDAAVKKLTDRQSQNEQRESASPIEWAPHLNMQIDPQAYLNMIRMIHIPQPSIFPLLSAPLLPKEEKDDLMDDDGDKRFEDSSPSPSEDLKDDCDGGSGDIDKPFVCDLPNCQKRFANKFLLKKHMFIHTGLRPHTCPFCSKRFNRKDNLLRHKKTHLQNGAVEFGKQALNLFMGEAGAIALDDPIDPIED